MRWMLFGVAVVYAFNCQVKVKADLIITPPTGAKVIFDGTNDEDAVTEYTTLGANFRFFGSTRTTVSIAENGNLNFSNDNIFFPDALGTTNIARIAPLWDDFLLLQDGGRINNRVVEHSVSGSYFAVTWQNVRLQLETAAGGFFPDTDRSFQVLWFEADTTIRGFDFKRDDIAFSYVGDVAGTDDFGLLFATVGLDAGDRIRFTPLPGTALNDGQIVQTDGRLLAWQDNSFLHFQAIGDGASSTYTANLSSLSAVPEPSTFLTLAVSALGLLATRRRRGQNGEV